MERTFMSGTPFGVRDVRGRETCTEGTKLSDHDSKCNSVYDSGCIDSGFHSGANLSSEQFMSEEIRPSRHGSDTESESISKTDHSDSKSYTRLDSGVDLTDQFSSLNLRSSNDLNDPSSKCHDSYVPNINVPILEGTTELPSNKSSPSSSSWEHCYKQNEEGDTDLHIAVIQGFIELVYALVHIAPEPSLLDIKNYDRQTPLHLAVLTGQVAVARRLVAAGASVSLQEDAYGNTALHMASMSGSLEMLKALLETQPAAVDLQKPNYDGMMCVHLAALNGHAAALSYLIRAGANINVRELKGGRTVLHLAVEYGRGNVIQLLLEEGLQLLQLDATTYAGLTAYQLAACVDSALANRLANRGAEARPFPADECGSEEDDEELDADEMYRNFHGKSFQQQLTLNGDPINASA